MGEAKRRQKAGKELFRTHLLRETEKWSSAPSDAEARTVAAISKLPTVPVKRLPRETLNIMGMPPNACHTNCLWYADGEPQRKVRLGWIRDEFGVYILHSVIEEAGAFKCITPSRMGAPDDFEFIPDDDVQMVRVDERYWKFQRDGIEIGHGVRADPTAMISRMGRLREALLRGDDPHTALAKMDA